MTVHEGYSGTRHARRAFALAALALAAIFVHETKIDDGDFSMRFQTSRCRGRSDARTDDAAA